MLESLLDALEETKQPIDIIDAIMNDDIDACRNFIRQGIAAGKTLNEIIHEQNYRTYLTPLAAAIKSGKEDTLQFLISECSADVNAVDIWGATPLKKAAQHNQAGSARVLLSHGADVNLNSPLTLALECRHLDFACMLINEFHANVNVTCSKGVCTTPLQIAANSNHPELVRALILKGVLFDEQNKSGDTAINFAHRQQYQNIVALLLRAGAKPPFDNPQGESAARCYEEGYEKGLAIAYEFSKKTSENKNSAGFLKLKSAIKKEKKAKKVNKRITSKSILK